MSAVRTAVVTGGTVRLGKVVADALAAAGWRVLRTSHRSDAGADIVADLADPLGPARLFAAACGLNGGRCPDALVNNAALFTGDASRLRAVNLIAPQKLTVMMAGREEGCGAVVNVLDAREREGVYGETKRALAADTARAAAMFADTLRVNAVAPGPVLRSGAVRERAGICPLGRPTPEAVAAAIVFLLEAPFTTGCVIPVDGGAAIVASSE